MVWIISHPKNRKILEVPNLTSEILQESFEIIAQCYGDSPPEIKSIVRGKKKMMTIFFYIVLI